MQKNKIKLSATSLYKIKSVYGINSRLNPQYHKNQIEYSFQKLDLEKRKQSNYKYIEFYKNVNSYKGTRHKKSLPVRGQRTHTNAKTNKKKYKVKINNQFNKTKKN